MKQIRLFWPIKALILLAVIPNVICQEDHQNVLPNKSNVSGPVSVVSEKSDSFEENAHAKTSEDGSVTVAEDVLQLPTPPPCAQAAPTTTEPIR